MSQLKPGQRLKSAVCAAEVMVIKVDGDAAITCGGAPMLAADDAPAEGSAADPEQMSGCAVGKRYVNAGESLELLCVKAGHGTLASDGDELAVKGIKNLPSSD
jgi:hypothetical protein